MDDSPNPFLQFQQLLQFFLQNSTSPNTSLDPRFLLQSLPPVSPAGTSSTISTPDLSLVLSQLSSPSFTDISSSSSSSVTSPNDTISSIDSGISSPSNILKELDSLEKKSTPGCRSRQRIRREWCSVCKSSIVKNGCRSQGPRRHIMQHHLMKPMFLCPVPNCDFSSNYDKAHVHAHIRRMHQGMQEEAKVVDKKVYQAEEDVWMERCFGVRISREATQEEKENQPSPVKKEEVPESEDSKHHPFSINTLLTPTSQPPAQPQQTLQFLSPMTPIQRSILAILDQAMANQAAGASSP